MKNTINTIKEIHKGMHPVTKYTFRYGSILILTLIFCAVYFYIQSQTSDFPYYYNIIYADILYSIKECMGSIFVLPMLYETISMSVKL